MNSLVSLMAPPANAAASDPASGFVAPPPQSKSSFGSVLERTLHRAPERKAPNARAERPRSERRENARDEQSPPLSRTPLRSKQREEEAALDTSLAGACAVSGQPVQLDESVPPQGVVAETDATPTPATTAAAGDEGVESSAPSEAASAGELLLDAEAQISSTNPAQSCGNTASFRTTEQTATPAMLPDEASAPDNSSIAVELIGADGLTPAVEPEDSQSVAVRSDEFNLIASARLAREAEVRNTTTAQATETTDLLATPEVASQENRAAMPGAVALEAQKTARAARQFRADQTETLRGIAGANYGSTMKTGPNMEEIAGNTQQLLPSAAAGPVAALPTLPTEDGRKAGNVGSSPESLLEAGRLAPAPVRLDTSDAGELTEVTTPPSVARTAELISREVRMFKRGGDDLVEVVLTPDVKTQISLRLQWREGQVEVQARCDFGDYRSLNTEWPQLQAALASQGVRLSHLSERATTGFTDFFNQQGFSQRQGGEQGQGHERSGAEAGIPPLPTTNPKTNPSANPRGNRRFDYWA